MSAPYSADELARRRAKARRLAWLLGGAVALLYLVGLFIKRG